MSVPSRKNLLANARANPSPVVKVLCPEKFGTRGAWVQMPSALTPSHVVVGRVGLGGADVVLLYDEDWRKT